MDASIGYTKNNKQDMESQNKRNGHSPKTVKSQYREFQVDIPRDREGVQRCIIHILRNSFKYVFCKDIKKFASDYKAVYKAPTEEAMKIQTSTKSS